MKQRLLETKGERTKLENRVLLAVLLFVGVFTIADILSDVGEGAGFFHLFGEASVALASFAGAFLLWRRTQGLRSEIEQQSITAAAADLERQEALIEASRWKNEAQSAIQGLSGAIDTQLSRWHLTGAEKEVALLILKGLSLKEIAEIRSVSEKTVRAQSFAIYSKSGLSGRAELSAFFLEDLLLPTT